jgi:hypothetical protein
MILSALADWRNNIMPNIIRFVFIAAFAAVCLFSEAKTALAQHTYTALIEASYVGIFAGDSICVGNRPACKNEKVVVALESTGRDGDLLLTFDFTRDGVRVPFFKQKLQYDRSAKYFTGKFLTSREWVNEAMRPGTELVFTITVVATYTNVLEGTITLTDSNTVVRRMILKRVNPNETAPAQSNILQQVRSGSRFVLDRKKSGNIDVITGAGPGAPGGHVKAFSGETWRMLRPAENVVITHTTSEVSVKFDNSAPLKSPTNGQPVSSTRLDGAKYNLTSWLKNGSLIQVLSSSDETVTRTFTVSGTTLRVKVEARGKPSRVWEYEVVATGEIF